MNIKTKKLTLGALAAVTAIAVPVATVVSCGDKKETTPAKSKTGTTTTQPTKTGTTTTGTTTTGTKTTGKKTTGTTTGTKTTGTTTGTKTTGTKTTTTAVVKKVTQADVDKTENYEKQLELLRSKMEADIATPTKKVFVFDNGHGIKPVFADSKADYIKLIESQFDSLVLESNVYNVKKTDLGKEFPKKPTGFKSNVFKQGYMMKADKTFRLYANNTIVYKTIADAKKDYAKVADKFIKEITVDDLISGTLSTLRQQFVQYGLKGDFSKIDAYIKAKMSKVKIPVADKAAADALIKKYVTLKPAETTFFKKGTFTTGSGSYATSFKSANKYYMTMGLMVGKKEKIDPKIDSNTLVDNVEEIAYVKAGYSHSKSLGFTFVKVGGKWYLATDYVKSIFNGITFKNAAYWAFDLTTIDAKFKDLLDYTKTVLGNPTPAPTVSQDTTSIYA